ncbi:phage recombination protein Bet [Alicyclobacillus sp. ALC3]|uniref:phage recombination protein Bet n=1 Tax=Alicyclobacillus sp. ALC3 TaxID=2796143 RepID=UPI00237942F9|nr:phage recombination protein Bet [Alicyclobacillus sp. ALC3]WDL96383.1 phage recombination protein Bet [Alicyclobacillus sp. ALC3]
MSTAEKNLTVIQGGTVPTLNVSNDEKLKAIRSTVAKDANDAEFTMLMHLANTYHLDPFLKEIWFIKYGTTPTIMVSRDGLRNYAQRQEDFEGLLSQEVRKGDKFSYNPITKEIHHETGDGSGEITKAYAIVYRKGRKPHIELVDFREYFTALSGKNGVWKSHPSAMVKKVAEVLALKKCYTITGLYAPEEMGMQEPDTMPAPDFDIPNTMGSAVPDEDSHAPEVRPAVDKRAWKKAIDELSLAAEAAGITASELRPIGARVTGKEVVQAWSLDDIANVRQYIEQYSQPAEPEASPSAQPTEAFDLPSDEDLPF